MPPLTGSTGGRPLWDAKEKAPSNELLGALQYGGRCRNRTGVHGFAIRCITTLPTGLKTKAPHDFCGAILQTGAGNETCTRTVSRCFPNTFFVGLASEDLNCSLVFRPRQQIRPKSSTDVQRAALSTPDPRSVHRRRRLPRTHHPRPVVCPASIIVKTIRQMVLVMAQVGCWERLHHNSQGPSAQAPLKERARWPPRFRTRFFVDISG